MFGILTELKESGGMSEELVYKLRSCGGVAPLIYGLAKVHKTGTPVRPVLSMPGSPYYKVAKQVADWLAMIPEAQINCSSKSIVDQLQSLQLDEEEVMISFDVSSLYTNVPVKEAIAQAAERLYEGDLQQPPVDKETFMILAEISSCGRLCQHMMDSTNKWMA